jgi:integrase
VPNSQAVFKRGRIWWLRYTVGNRQVRESAKTTRKAEAEALLNKRLADIFQGRYFPHRRQADLTFSGLKVMWLSAKKGKATLSHDEQRFRRIVDHFGPSKLISTVSAEDIDGFKEALLQSTTSRGTPMAPATVNRYLALLRSAFRLAGRRRYKHSDPMAGVEMLPENNDRDRICSPEEHEQLVEHADPELRLVVEFGYWMGMRLGEIANLTWDQIDLKHGFVRLRRKDTKEAAAKQVPLASELVEILKEEPRRINGRLFVSRSDTLSTRFAELTRKQGISDLRFHDLRHTAVTRLRRAGVDILVIQHITGHKTLSMLARYNKATEADLKTAMKKAEQYETQTSIQQHR